MLGEIYHKEKTLARKSGENMVFPNEGNYVTPRCSALRIPPMSGIQERDFCLGSKNGIPNILRLSGLNNARFAQDRFGMTVFADG